MKRTAEGMTDGVLCLVCADKLGHAIDRVALAKRAANSAGEERVVSDLGVALLEMVGVADCLR